MLVFFILLQRYAHSSKFKAARHARKHTIFYTLKPLIRQLAGAVAETPHSPPAQTWYSAVDLLGDCWIES